MKKFALLSSLTIASASLFLFCGSSSDPAAIQKAAASSPTLGSSLPTSIDLSDSTSEEIRNYYSSLNSLNAEERRGNNLLKNLKPILQDFTYYKYDDVWKIYEITDREWSLSPAESDSENGITYDESSNSFTSYKYGTSNTNGGSNPYVHTLYRNRDENGVTVADAQIREWGDHNATGTNREHVWCQSRGFKADSGADGPAGTDIHHLMSGDGKVNQSYHNNSPYGYVDKTQTYKNASSNETWLDGNLLGPQLHTHSEDQETSVFEPQDSDKGDIARACFYMAACYNNWSGEETITQFNPNLILSDYATDAGAAEDSSASHPVAMGILSDLLEWHKLDPVDEYEIHRNNLIYKNYQHNRNPFIDFPDWVDIIWGDEKDSSTAKADPENDKIGQANDGSALSLSDKSISLAVGESKTVSANVDNGIEVTWSIEDSSLIEIAPNGNSCKVTALKESGSTKLNATATIDGEEVSASCLINVKDKAEAESDNEPIDEEELSPFDRFVQIIYDLFPFLGPNGAYILAGAILLILIIIVIAVFASASKKMKKKMIKKAAKKSSKSKKK